LDVSAQLSALFFGLKQLVTGGKVVAGSEASLVERLINAVFACLEALFGGDFVGVVVDGGVEQHFCAVYS